MSLFVTKDTSSTSWLGSNVTGDSQNRYVVQAGGKTLWGPGGTSALDVILQRSTLQFFANPLLTLYRGDESTPGDMFMNSVCLSNNSAIINLQGTNALMLPTEWGSSPSHGWADLGNGNILFRNTSSAPNGCQFKDGVYTSLFQVMVQDPSDMTNYTPFLATDHGFWVEKDIQTYGALFTSSDPGKNYGGGAIMIGHGFQGPADAPSINLTDSGLEYPSGSSFPQNPVRGQCFNNTTLGHLYRYDGSQWVESGPICTGHFNTLFLKQFGGSPAHLDLGNLTVHGNLIVYGAFWNASLINALFNFPDYLTGFGQTFLSNLISTIGNTLHYSSNKVDINPSSTPTLAGLTLNGALQVNAPSQTGITLGNGTLYWQTATNPHVLEMNCGLIIDGALNVAGISINGQLGITSTSLVTNLNADMLDGYHASSFVTSGSSPSFANVTASGSLILTGSTGSNLYWNGISGANLYLASTSPVMLAIDGSLRVGTYLYCNNMVNATGGITVSGELRIPTSAPGSPQNGDIWLA